MRYFGSLPRPQSRFRRPLSSWLWRVASAGKLRLGFLLVYLVVAGAAGAKLYSLMRSYGYFYPLAERQALWRKFPQDPALVTLETIYGNKSELTEMRLVRMIRQPLAVDPHFEELLKDPNWSRQARIARSAAFDARLSDLEKGAYFSRFEELLAVSDQGRLLDSEQRQRLDNRRRTEVEWFVNEAQPESEVRCQAFCFRMWGNYSRPWPLEQGWRKQMLAAARQQQRKLVARLSPHGDQSQDTVIMRRLQLEVRLAGLDPGLVGPLSERATHISQWQPPNISEEQLALIAHYKKVLPKLDLSALSASLTAEKRQVLDCLRDLTANPR